MEKNLNKTTKNILLGAAIVFAVGAVLFSFLKVYPFKNQTANELINASISRICAGVAAVLVIIIIGFGNVLKIKSNGFFKNLLWCLPCFLVVVANFPFSALILGAATLNEPQFIALLLLKCFAIALMEEAIFRGIVHGFVQERMTDRKYPTFAAIFISSTIFALWHLLNLLEGAGVGATFLQVGYTFLTGAMFAAVTVKTGNIWGAVIMHALFDFGGFIVNDLGEGLFQDTTFWVLTAVCGAICLAHVLWFIYKKDKSLL